MKKATAERDPERRRGAAQSAELGLAAPKAMIDLTEVDPAGRYVGTKTKPQPLAWGDFRTPRRARRSSL